MRSWPRTQVVVVVLWRWLGSWDGAGHVKRNMCCRAEDEPKNIEDSRQRQYFDLYIGQYHTGQSYLRAQSHYFLNIRRHWLPDILHPSRDTHLYGHLQAMPHATMPPPGFQALILCGPGASISTFTSNPKDIPKALIPIANRPMVWYPLEWCYRMGVTSM